MENESQIIDSSSKKEIEKEEKEEKKETDPKIESV